MMMNRMLTTLNQRVEPSADYTYDDLYRLIEATDLVEKVVLARSRQESRYPRLR